MGLYDYTIYSTIKRNARVNGKRIALSCEENKVTYNQFLENVDRLACGLTRIGLKKGDRIGILALNSLHYMVLYGAVAKTGTILVPINWRLKPQEIAYIISSISPRIFFVGAEFEGLISSLMNDVECIERYYSIDQESKLFTSFGALLENEGDEPGGDVSFDDEFVIIQTAAVHGKPRGATISHKSLLLSNMQLINYWRLTHDDVNLGLMPLFHNFGLVTALAVMQAGGRTVITPKFDAEVALRCIQEDKVTVLGEMTPMLNAILDRNLEGDYDLSSLRVVTGMDSPETTRRLEETTGATFWAAYAQSETAGFVSLAPYSERPGSSGVPCPMSEIDIMDESGRILGPGMIGEIVVRGPMLFKGYWNLEKENEYTFRNGWHHTGDFGYLDNDGYLWYAGRTPEKDLIKPGGENVYPAEVERVLLEHPSVEEVSVIGVADQEWGEAIKAVCVLKKEKKLEEKELIEFVAARIARYKKPKYVVFVSDLPKTEGGFIDREKVKIEYCGL